MTTQEKLIRRKQSLLELAEYLQNISQACKIHGVSRQHFYDIKKTYEEHGLKRLREKSRLKRCVKNYVAPKEGEAVLAYEYPVYGQGRAINGLRKKRILVSEGGNI
jgi:transposase